MASLRLGRAEQDLELMDNRTQLDLTEGVHVSVLHALSLLDLWWPHHEVCPQAAGC